MSAKTFRLIGIILLIVAAVVAVLNLKRVAGLGLPWLSPIFIVLGAAFMIQARRRSR